MRKVHQRKLTCISNLSGYVHHQSATRVLTSHFLCLILSGANEALEEDRGKEEETMEEAAK